jgi:hypothetical protein
LVDARVVYTELDDFTQASSLLPKVDDNSDTTSLRTFHCFSQREDQIRPTTADVASKNIRADALVVHPHHSFNPRVTEFSCISEGIYGATSHGWNIGSHLGVQQTLIVRISVQGLPELLFREI